MIVNISVKKLQDILDLGSRFVSKHSTLPVLENIYIKGHIDSILFRATDMEKYIEVEIPAQIESQGAITVNARTLSDIIKSIEEDEVKLIIDESKDILTIRTSFDEFKIKGISANEYVAVPEVSSGNNIQIDASDFAKGISKVEYAVVEKNFSPVLTGVLIRVKKYGSSNKIVFVGTDSFRLAEYKMDFHGDSKEMEIIVPKMNIGDIKKIADFFVDKGGIDMKISFSENLVSFYFELDGLRVMATSLLIQGRFPEYENENIIPTKFNTKVVVDKNQIEKAIKKISILTRDMNNFIDVKIQNSNLIITSGETDKGEAKTVISAIVDGQDMNFGINGKYVADFLRGVNSSEILLNIVNGERPILFKDTTDDKYTCVVRPLVK